MKEGHAGRMDGRKDGREEGQKDGRAATEGKETASSCCERVLFKMAFVSFAVAGAGVTGDATGRFDVTFRPWADDATLPREGDSCCFSNRKRCLSSSVITGGGGVPPPLSPASPAAAVDGDAAADAFDCPVPLRLGVRRIFLGEDSI
jgi:hypothetical protein